MTFHHLCWIDNSSEHYATFFQSRFHHPTPPKTRYHILHAHSPVFRLRSCQSDQLSWFCYPNDMPSSIDRHLWTLQWTVHYHFREKVPLVSVSIMSILPVFRLRSYQSDELSWFCSPNDMSIAALIRSSEHCSELSTISFKRRLSLYLSWASTLQVRVPTNPTNFYDSVEWHCSSPACHPKHDPAVTFTTFFTIINLWTHRQR